MGFYKKSPKTRVLCTFQEIMQKTAQLRLKLQYNFWVFAKSL